MESWVLYAFGDCRVLLSGQLSTTTNNKPLHTHERGVHNWYTITPTCSMIPNNNIIIVKVTLGIAYLRFFLPLLMQILVFCMHCIWDVVVLPSLCHFSLSIQPVQFCPLALPFRFKTDGNSKSEGTQSFRAACLRCVTGQVEKSG